MQNLSHEGRANTVNRVNHFKIMLLTERKLLLSRQLVLWVDGWEDLITKKNGKTKMRILIF